MFIITAQDGTQIDADAPSQETYNMMMEKRFAAMTIRVTFGQGPDKVVMTDVAESIYDYLTYLKSAGWEIDQVTKAEVIE
jgi:hypothetical protein